jgi:Tfp pilus assembly PilM family ATPase
MLETLAQRMNVETHRVNPFERVPYRPDAGKAISLEEAGPMLLLPLGLALRTA